MTGLSSLFVITDVGRTDLGKCGNGAILFESHTKLFALAWADCVMFNVRAYDIVRYSAASCEFFEHVFLHFTALSRVIEFQPCDEAILVCSNCCS